MKHLHPIPEMPVADSEGNEPTEEQKNAAQKRIDEVTKLNNDIEKVNDEINKIQSKVKIAYRPPIN